MKTRHGMAIALFVASGMLAGAATITGAFFSRGASTATTGLAGVTIELLSPNGTVLATTQTDTQGRFVFSNAVENASVRLKTACAGYALQVNSDH